jgi:hypothetical protein
MPNCKGLILLENIKRQARRNLISPASLCGTAAKIAAFGPKLVPIGPIV